MIYVSTESVELHGENYHIRKFTGVDKFHNAGYYGERVYASTGENWDINNYNPDDLVLIPFGNGRDWGNYDGGHGTKTAATFFQVAPKAHLVQMSEVFPCRTGKNCYCGLEDNCLPYIKEYGITSIFCSFEMICDKYLAEKYTSILDELETFNFLISAGNESVSGYNKLAMCDSIITVGAYYVSGNKAKPEYFTSNTEYVDFGAPDKQTTKFALKTNIIEYGKNSGTSFSAPWLCGMICLVNDFFIDKTGKPLHYKKMYEFLKDYSKDVGDEGFDDEMGFGAPILPNPSDIEIDKYVELGGDTPLFNITETTTNNTKQPFDIIKINDYNVTCEKIPTTSIDKIDIVKCNEPTETLESFYNRQEIKPDIIINGGLFDMSTGHNVMSFIDEGVEQNYQNGFIGFGTTNDKYNNIQYGVDNQGGWKDFLTAHPVLVKNGSNTTEEEWGNATDINYGAHRQMVGYDIDNFYIITVDDNITFDVAQKIVNTINIPYVFNVDGGGSVRTMIFGEVTNTPTENRPVDSVICVYLKDKEQDVPSEPEIEIPDIELGEYRCTTDVNILVNVMDDSKILSVAHKDDILTIRSLMAYNGKIYANVMFDYQYGFAEYTGDNMVLFTAPPVEPEEPEIPQLPAVYIVEVNTTLNVRESPNGSILGVLYPQDEIVVYEISNGWAKFKYDIGNIEYAYCSTQYISYAYQYEEPEAPNDPDEPKEDFELDYTVLDTYTDKSSISGWAKDAVTYCVQKGYLTGSNNKLNPKDPLTREQFCTMIYRILEGDK